MTSISATTPSDPGRPKKLQRISQACDLCHRRSIRCRPSVENAPSQCQNCFDFAVECTYTRPSRRRRHPPDSQLALGPANASALQTANAEHRNEVVSPQSASISIHDSSADDIGVSLFARPRRPDEALGVAWRAFAVASTAAIDRYLGMYMDALYPIYPVFHGPTFWIKVRSRQYLSDRGFFASVMAACALTAARARDGALGDKVRGDEAPEPSSETFFAASQDAISKDLTRAADFEYLRACALLALTSIQCGKKKTAHQYIGHYSTLSAMQQFHDEANWPSSLSNAEREERRRLFWSMYNLDVYMSVVFGSILKSQETFSNVRYPSDLEDEGRESEGGLPGKILPQWFQGWNFITDMYRILEHLVRRVRRVQQQQDDRFAAFRYLITDAIPDVQVMQNVMEFHLHLPEQFKLYNRPVSGDRIQDMYTCLAANIKATVQLVHISLYESNGPYRLDEKCRLVDEVISSFGQIAPQFLRAISTPLVYHLGRIGHILASVLQDPLTQNSYPRIRGLLVTTADILLELESGLQRTAGTSKEIRTYVDKIDQFMQTQSSVVAMQQQQAPMPSMRPVESLPGDMMAYPSKPVAPQQPAEEFRLPPELMYEWPMWPFDFTSEANTSNLPLMNAGEGLVMGH